MMGVTRFKLAVLTFCAVASSAGAEDQSRQQANQRVVAEFYQKAINDKDFEAAAKYLGPRYIQHNQMARDGPEGLHGFKPGTRGTAIVDIFRLENGKIVEHWDVHEDISAQPVNQNGMF
jgi:predicted SnoaL-like aldol condensation-catalyzing enzyme